MRVRAGAPRRANILRHNLSIAVTLALLPGCASTTSSSASSTTPAGDKQSGNEITALRHKARKDKFRDEMLQKVSTELTCLPMQVELEDLSAEPIEIDGATIKASCVGRDATYKYVLAKTMWEKQP